MFKIRMAILLTAIFSTPSFADMSDHSKACGMVAKACSEAGFVRQHNAEKKFWLDCMKPVVLGETVKGVTVDAATVKECRENKIKEFKKELSEFEKVS